MEPVEINAGCWYLRAPRFDDRIDDRPAVVASCADPEICRWRRRPPPDLVEAAAYIRSSTRDWSRDDRYTWAVCAPSTGEMFGEVALAHLDLRHGAASATCWVLPAARRRGLATTAVSAVVRFGFGGLGLHRIEYAWAAGNPASGRVAERCGFVVEGRRRGAWLDEDGRADVVVAGRLATDR